MTEYQNMFGSTLLVTVIKADSIKRIGRSESIEPASETVIVNQTKEWNNIQITLQKIEFSDKNTQVYLTVENIDTSDDVNFYDFNSWAMQEKTQLMLLILMM